MHKFAKLFAGSRYLKSSVIPFLLILAGCGGYTPIPSHGGGKRFAVEQALVSATFRQVISELPLEQLKDKKVSLVVSIMHDEGGGSINGGRPYLVEGVSAQLQRTITTQSNGFSRGINILSNSNDNIYSKDLSFNNSDSVQFVNLLSSALSRQNILINPKDKVEGQADYLLEVIVDVIGTWRSKSDWIVANNERLKAITSIEYVVTPLQMPSEKRRSGRISYEAEYLEEYVAWVGPGSSMTLRRSEISQILPSLGNGTDNYTNLSRGVRVEFPQPEKNRSIQINPKSK